MKFNRSIFFFPLVSSLFLYPVLAENPTLAHLSNTSQNVDHVIWDGNNISTWHGNHGDIVSYHMTGNSGLEWPKGSGKAAVFQAGLWLAAGKVNGTNEIRTAAAEYSIEYVPGNWGEDSDDPAFHVYEINSNDGAGSTNWSQWPVDQGAPWIDINYDGYYSPLVDKPDIIGDKTHWYVMNDGDESVHTPLWGTEPLDVEVRTTIFGFNSWGALANTMFVKYQIINTGENQLDSMFVSHWFDPDIGDATDDLVGCDPQLNLGFSYNDNDGDGVYGENPPAVGCLVLQTPVVSSPGDTAYVSGTEFPNYRNLLLSSFSMYGVGVNFVDPNTPEEAYRYMNGLIGLTGAAYIDPITREPSTFVYDGDPITEEGWIDGIDLPPGDRRFLMSSGPLSMMPGESQEVVIAIIIAQGESSLASLSALRSDVVWIKNTWDSGFIVLGAPAKITQLYAPENTESSGPLEFYFRITENPEWDNSTDLAFLHFGMGEIQDSVELTEVYYEEEAAFSGIIPEFTDVTATQKLEYYLSLIFDDGIKFYWPPSAPSVPATLIFGPDTTAPVVSNLTDLPDVLYLIDDYADVLVRAEDDRFPVSVLGNWKVNGDGEVNKSPLELLNNTWFGQIYWEDLSLGDRVYYWVEVEDSSSNQNRTISEVKSFVAKSFGAIGNWEYENLDRWNLGKYWHLADNEDLGKVMTIYPLDVGEKDTLSLSWPLDISNDFPQVFLHFEHAYSFVESVSGYIDVRVGNNSWQTVQIYSSGEENFKKEWISLDDYIGNDSLYIQFRVEKLSNPGANIWYIDDIFLTSEIVNISIEGDRKTFPEQFSLYQNYPNPFNPQTTIEFSIPHSSKVTLTIYDVRGREVETILNKHMQAGHHKLQWKASDVPSGIYFVRMQSGDFKQVRKVMVVR